MSEQETGQLRDLVHHMERRLRERYELGVNRCTGPACGDLRQRLATLRTIDQALRGLPATKRKAVVERGVTFEMLDTIGAFRVQLADQRAEQTFTNGDATSTANWLREHA